MQTLFEIYDQWNGLVTIICGIYATLLSYGYIPGNPKDPEKLALWRRKFGPTMKVLSPLIILFGTFTLVNALLKDDSIAAQVAEINLHSPREVDPVTRFDHATAGPGQRITFNNTVTSITHGQVNVEMWAKFSKELRQKLYTVNVRRLQQKGVTLVYSYRDVNGQLIGELVISPNDPPPN